MKRERANYGYHRMAVNETFIHLGSRAVFLNSISQSRFVHLRDAIGDGLERLTFRDRLYVRATASRYRRSNYQGEHIVIMTFTPRYGALLGDIRAELRAVTESKSTFFDAIVLALLESAEANQVPGNTPLPETGAKEH